MTRTTPKNPSLWILAALVAAAATTALVLPSRVGAQGGSQVETFYSAPVSVEGGDTMRVGVSNVGRRPVRIQVLLLDANDFSTIEQGPTLALQPGTTSFEDITRSLGLGVVAAVRVRGNSKLRFSLQVIDPSGDTQIFTDGFESGDLAA